MKSIFTPLWLIATILGVIGAAESASPIFDGTAELKPAGHIDRFVFARWKELGIQPAALCSDAVFVRRVYLDAIGTVPTAEEVKAFLVDDSPNKRSKLIDRLLEREEFADYWAMKWSDLLRVKAEFPINLWPNAAQAYHRWIRASIRENLSYDRFVREMLTANGSNFRVGQVNFYRAVQSKTPQGIAQAVALTFMGSRADGWPKERLEGMAAFFAQIGYKASAEWKEEIVAFDPTKVPEVKTPAIYPDGTPAQIAAGRDPRKAFADWLITPKNPWFTRNITNRVWSWLLGRGIVHEPDDIRPDNPPSNPELLVYLEKELVDARYDLKQLYRLILNSTTYQLSSIPRDKRPEAKLQFAVYPVRRLEAEVLIDALNDITGTHEQYSSPIPEPFTYIPEGQRSIALPDGSITSPFLEQFGRPSRDTGMESERSNRPTPDQWLHLLNSSHIQKKIEGSPKLQALLQQAAAAKPSKPNRRDRNAKPEAPDRRPVEVVNTLYLTILSRYPTADELKTVGAYMQGTSLKREAAFDLAWALINSAEFLYRH